MSRLPALPPEQLDDRQRELYERVSGGPRAAGPQRFRLTEDDGSLTGPFNVFLHAPAVGEALGAVGEAIRYGTSLPPRLRELAILCVAGHRDSAFERYAHERVGRAVGLTDAELRAFRELDDVRLEDPQEAAAYAFCRQALVDRGVDDDVYATAVDHLGQVSVVELAALLAYYEGVALLLSVFEVGVPADPDPPVEDGRAR
jgi:4-carboxymuconolactone decarboxylase